MSALTNTPNLSFLAFTIAEAEDYTDTWTRHCRPPSIVQGYGRVDLSKVLPVGDGGNYEFWARDESKDGIEAVIGASQLVLSNHARLRFTYISDARFTVTSSSSSAGAL